MPSPSLDLDWARVLGWRLQQQRLDRPEGDAVELAARLAGVQAQVASSAVQVLSVRATDPAVDLDRLLWQDRALVKTWAMRGTLHLLPANEWNIWVAVLRTRAWRITPAWVRYHGVTEDELDAVTAAIPEALAGDPLTREELADRVAALTGHAHLGEQLRSGWAAVFKPAANRGLLCQGPPREGRITFTDPARWLAGAPGSHTPGPGPRPASGPGSGAGASGGQEPGSEVDPDPHDAMATVLARFLDAYGPATRDDLARWLGETPKVARLILAAHADDLVEVRVDGRAAWMTPAGAEAAADAEPARGVQLLPGFDPYVLAPLSHRAHTIPEGRVDAVSRAAGWISPVLLVDGRVAGTWATERAGDVTTATVTPFGDLPAAVVADAERHLHERYAVTLGPDLQLVVA